MACAKMQTSVLKGATEMASSPGGDAGQDAQEAVGSAPSPALQMFSSTLPQGCSAYPSQLRSCPLAVIKVTASWCGPCQNIHPVYVELVKAAPNMTGFTLDIDAAPDAGGDYMKLSDLLDASALPTFVFFRHGAEVARLVGGDVTQLRGQFAQITANQGCGAQSVAIEENTHASKRGA
jgi:thiol-disulfide isomerase/thioredoxin